MDLPDNFSDNLALASIWMVDAMEPDLNSNYNTNNESAVTSNSQSGIPHETPIPPLCSPSDAGVPLPQCDSVGFFDPDLSLFCQTHFPRLLVDNAIKNNPDISQASPYQALTSASQEIQSSKSILSGFSSPGSQIKNDESITFWTMDHTGKMNGSLQSLGNNDKVSHLPSLPSSRQLDKDLTSIWNNPAKSLKLSKTACIPSFGDLSNNGRPSIRVNDLESSKRIAPRNNSHAVTEKHLRHSNSSLTNVNGQGYGNSCLEYKNTKAGCEVMNEATNGREPGMNNTNLSQVGINFRVPLSNDKQQHSFNLEDFLNEDSTDDPASGQAISDEITKDAEQIGRPMTLDGSTNGLVTFEAGLHQQNKVDLTCARESTPGKVTGQQWLKNCHQILEEIDPDAFARENGPPTDSEVVNRSFEIMEDDAHLRPDTESLCDLFEGVPAGKDTFGPGCSVQTPSRVTGKRKPLTPLKSPRARDPTFRGVVMKIKTKLQDDRAHLDIRAYFSCKKNCRRHQHLRRRYLESNVGVTKQKCEVPVQTSVVSEKELLPKEKRRRCPLLGKQCASCGTKKTPLWRDAEDGTSLCNACGIRSVKCLRSTV